LSRQHHDPELVLHTQEEQIVACVHAEHFLFQRYDLFLPFFWERKFGSGFRGLIRIVLRGMHLVFRDCGHSIGSFSFGLRCDRTFRTSPIGRVVTYCCLLVFGLALLLAFRKSPGFGHS
jgi:hypothetical protein